MWTATASAATSTVSAWGELSNCAFTPSLSRLKVSIMSKSECVDGGSDSGITAGGFGAVAGIFALQFFSEVPKVRKDIMQVSHPCHNICISEGRRPILGWIANTDHWGLF